MATDNEQLRQAAAEHDELVRITREYLAEQFGVFSGHQYDAIARGLLARYADRGYIWEKVTQ